jgi:stage V sporulation protein K
MYPKQIFKAQGLYEKNKKFFLEIDNGLHDKLVEVIGKPVGEHTAYILIISDIGYIAKRLEIELDSSKSTPELILILSFITYLINVTHHIKGLQGNDTSTKQKLINYYDEIQNSDFEKGLLIKVISDIDEDSTKLYTNFLLEFAQAIVSADKDLTSKEIEEISFLSKELSENRFGQGDNDDQRPADKAEIQKSGKPNGTKSKENTESLPNILEELDGFTGMEGIKKDVRTLINVLRIQKQRESQGLAVVKPSLHMVFTGPPGTGKTTVARIIGKIFKSLGVLEKGHMIETDRSGLVAGYLGQTAIKVDSVVNEAKDGVLFIDEAYTLSQIDGQDSFGQEAIDTLLKRMEDMRECLVVIVAGYEEEMQRFIESNPGFKSRFNRYINFVDYTADELIEIFKTLVKKNHYIASDALISKLHAEFHKNYMKRDRTFGNGRYVRNVFEKTIENQSNRLAAIEGELTNEDLQLLTGDDFTE